MLKKQGIEVLGISPDDEQKHQRFIEKFTLPFTLLADPTMKVINDYGVWGEKNMYGRKYMGLKRTTFLINEDGKIHEIIKKYCLKTYRTSIKSLGFVIHSFMIPVYFKTNSWLAKLAAAILHKDNCAMVIRHTIHLHRITKVAILQDERLLCHELTHVMQWRQQGL